MSTKGVKDVNTYIYCIEINKCPEMFLVVDIVNIGIGWRFIRSYILIVNVMKIKRTNSVRFFIPDIQNKTILPLAPGQQ